MGKCGAQTGKLSQDQRQILPCNVATSVHVEHPGTHGVLNLIEDWLTLVKNEVDPYQAKAEVRLDDGYIFPYLPR